MRIVPDRRGVAVRTKNALRLRYIGCIPLKCITGAFHYPPDMQFTALKQGGILMKSFFSLFSDSAKELKSVKCLALTGMLVAIFIILDSLSFKIGEFAKVNFAFAALATVGMLFGPVPGILAALAGDLIGCIISGQSPLPLLSLTAMLEGCLYGMLLYKAEGKKLAAMSVAARLIDSFVINLVLNTLILMSAGFMSQTWEQFGVRVVKICAEAIIYCPLLAAFLPTVRMIYKKVFRGSVRPAE